MAMPIVRTESAPPVESTESETPHAALLANGAAIASPAPSRKEHLATLVRALVEELSGTSLGGAEAGTSFLEIGLDSLLLTQAATLFQRKFGVPISFRQLMEDLSTIDAVGDASRRATPRGRVRPGDGSPSPAQFDAGADADFDPRSRRFSRNFGTNAAAAAPNDRAAAGGGA